MWCVKSLKKGIYLRKFAAMLLKFTRLFIKLLSFFNQTIQMASFNTSIKRPGRPKNEVWEHYQQNITDSEGHALATCTYCGLRFTRGEITVLQGHLANHCKEVPASVIRKYQEIFKDKGEEGNRKKKPKGQMLLDDYHETDQPLPQGKINRINKALIRFFICCGISF